MASRIQGITVEIGGDRILISFLCQTIFMMFINDGKMGKLPEPQRLWNVGWHCPASGIRLKFTKKPPFRNGSKFTEMCTFLQAKFRHY